MFVHLGLFVLIWLIGVVVALLFIVSVKLGVQEGYSRGKCNYNARYKIYNPGFKLGCWLIEEVDTKELK